ncbi:MAG: cupredoxin domain-containing protein [Solirubrobacteraceae bacterium]
MSTINTDQQNFDREVAHKGKLFHEVLGGFGNFAAVVMSLVALIQSTSTTSAQPGPAAAAAAQPSTGSGAMGSSTKMGGGAAGAAAGAAAATSSAAASTGAPQEVSLTVTAEGKKGPEGKMHDDFSVTEFHVVVGKPLTLNINNTDSVPHSINAPEAGINLVAQPGTHKYTLVATKAGKFEWNCMYPCDPWSMEHVGYMRGFITATAS